MKIMFGWEKTAVVLNSKEVELLIDGKELVKSFPNNSAILILRMNDKEEKE